MKQDRGHKVTNKRKDDEIRIRVTVEQKRTLTEAATKAGLGLSPWLRSLAVQEAQRLLQG